MKVAIPHMGKYSEPIIKQLGESLGWEVVMPPLPSQKTIELGSKYMNELMCLPAKVTLGTMIEACEMGAEHLIMFDSCGQCRLKTYWILQERVLKKLGYDVSVHPMRLGKGTPHDIRRIDPSVPLWKAWLTIIKILRQVNELDKRLWVEILDESNLVKIGIVGEIYTILSPDVNKGLQPGVKTCFTCLGIKYQPHQWNFVVLADVIKYWSNSALRHTRKRGQVYYPVKFLNTIINTVDDAFNTMSTYLFRKVFMGFFFGSQKHLSVNPPSFHPASIIKPLEDKIR